MQEPYPYFLLLTWSFTHTPFIELGGDFTYSPSTEPPPPPYLCQKDLVVISNYTTNTPFSGVLNPRNSIENTPIHR